MDRNADAASGSRLTPVTQVTPLSGATSTDDEGLAGLVTDPDSMALSKQESSDTDLDEEDYLGKDAHGLLDEDPLKRTHGGWTEEEENNIIRKFDGRLVLFMALLYMLSFLDRSSQSLVITIESWC